MATPLESQVRSILKEEISRLRERAIAPEEIPDDMPLFDVNEDGSENLGLDSLDALEIAMSIEEQYGVTVPQDVDFKELATINDIVTYVILQLHASLVIGLVPRLGKSTGNLLGRDFLESLDFGLTHRARRLYLGMPARSRR